MQEANGERRPRKLPRKYRRRSPLHMILMTLLSLFLVTLFTGSLLACFASVYIKNVILPDTALNVADYPMNLSSAIYYTDPVTGEEKEYETLHGDQDRVWLDYDEIPENLINAAVSIEDRRFYEHHGVDWLRTAKSVITMFTGGRIQGGSTITQQLIKNLTTYDDVTVKRKVTEIFRALAFDKKYSKKTTLEWYLNYIFFGHKCYGVYTASYAYFGKDVSELDLAECASLISITNNPSLYNPFTHPENNFDRRCLVLDAMLRDGRITEDECKAAKAEEIEFKSGKSSGREGTLYSWYTEQVITDVINDLTKKLDYSETVATDIVYSGGLKIYCCVNPEVQTAVDSVYQDRENLPYTSPTGQQLQSAIVVIDGAGNVAALSGKMGEKTVEDTRGFNMASRALRQPGSAIKPLSVYAPALENHLITPYSVYEDSPPVLLGDAPWPSNVNHRYAGQTTVNYAVTNSTNTIAVRVLQQLTPEAGFDFLVNRFHVSEDHVVRSKVIKDKEYSDIGLSQMALGGLTNGVTVMDMAGAYSVFPRGGVYISPRTYTRVVDNDGNEILKTESQEEEVLSKRTVYYMNEMLRNVVKAGTGTAAAFAGQEICGKTGSTNSNNDRWFVGYTPYYTAAVWVGYKNPERVQAPGNPAVGLWRKVMEPLHEGRESSEFPVADGLVSYEYCLDTGLLATDACRLDIRGSRAATGYVFPEDVPTESCSAHVMTDICEADPILNEKEEPTGTFHLAGEFCPTVDGGGDSPEEGISVGKTGRVSVAVLDAPRTGVEGVVIEDNIYYMETLRAAGTCTVHTEPIPVEPVIYDPAAFDITNPATWPSHEDDPHFNPADPETWPNMRPVPFDPETGEETSEGGEEPQETDYPVASPSEEPLLPPA